MARQTPYATTLELCKTSLKTCAAGPICPVAQMLTQCSLQSGGRGGDASNQEKRKAAEMRRHVPASAQQPAAAPFYPHSDRLLGMFICVICVILLQPQQRTATTIPNRQFVRTLNLQRMKADRYTHDCLIIGASSALSRLERDCRQPHSTPEWILSRRCQHQLCIHPQS
jgi:hypothetical protein